MFYKPNYCCRCGEKIEKPNFSPVKDSGRFCDVCKHDFPFQEIMPKVFIVLFGLFGLFGFGSYLYSGDSARAVALKQSKVSVNENIAKTETNGNQTENSNRRIVQQNPAKTELTIPTNASKNTAENRTSEVIKAVEEKSYYCGAATKKGTPCSRKVKGGGRCWQHKGQEAMYPPEKLLVSR